MVLRANLLCNFDGQELKIVEETSQAEKLTREDKKLGIEKMECNPKPETIKRSAIYSCHNVHNSYPSPASIMWENRWREKYTSGYKVLLKNELLLLHQMIPFLRSIDGDIHRCFLLNVARERETEKQVVDYDDNISVI